MNSYSEIEKRKRNGHFSKNVQIIYIEKILCSEIAFDLRKLLRKKYTIYRVH